MVKLATNWVFPGCQGLGPEKTLMWELTRAQGDKRTLSGETGGHSRHDLSVLCFQNKERKRRRKESHWELSFHMALKRTFSVAPAGATHPWRGRQQALSSFWDPMLLRASSRALHQMQVFSASSSLMVMDPGGRVAATVAAAALAVLPAGEELVADLGAWVLVYPGAVSACKLWLYPRAARWWSWGKGPTRVPEAGPYPDG